MKLAIARSGIALLFASLLQSCGGGGGDGNGGGPGSGSAPSLTVSPTNISVTATPGEASPAGSVTLTVRNPPQDGLFAGIAHSFSGIESLDLATTSATTAVVQIAFRSPGTLQNGNYDDTVEIHVCIDDQCATEIQGSPVTVTTSYVVSGTGVATATLDQNTFEAVVDSRDDIVHGETARLRLSTAPASGIHLQTDHSSNAVQNVFPTAVTNTITDLDIRFLAGSQLNPGTYNDTVTVQVCYDPSCVREVQGSPFTIATTLSVSAGVEPGFTPLEVESRTALPHNVIDADISKTLNQIVMVASYPVNALYIYDIASGAERQQLLSKTPSSVSIAPDGLTAAVGHDALISVIDLATAGTVGAPAPTLLNVSTNVADVVLDGAGHVHVFTATEDGAPTRSVDVATNTELTGPSSMYVGFRGRLHPSGAWIYTVSGGAFSPSDVDKWDITSGVMSYLYDSPYHGEYEACDDVWFSDDGATIYTSCGNTYRSNAVQAQDMIYAGSLELSSSTYGFRISSLSIVPSINEIALVERDFSACRPNWYDPCYTHFATYEADFHNRTAVYTIGPVTVNDIGYAQRGLFVFHGPLDNKKYMLSWLEGMPNPDAEYYLSVIP